MRTRSAVPTSYEGKEVIRSLSATIKGKGRELSHLFASKQNIVVLLVWSVGEGSEDELLPDPYLLRIRLNDLLSRERNDLLEGDGEDVGSETKEGNGSV